MKINKSSGTALITGAAKRIGHEIALTLASLGYEIVIHYNHSKKEALELSKKITKKYQIKTSLVAADLSNKNEIKKLADFMVNNFANWNLLINNASIFDKSKLLDFNDQNLFDNINIHLVAPLFLSQAFAKNVKQKRIQDSQIINLIDKNITRIETSYFYYLLSKKFLAELTKMSALELAPDVRVNGIAPGFILPEESENLRVKNIEKKIPLRKAGDVKNITQTVEFLLKNKFISGEIIFVDGAASLNHAG